MEYSFKVVNLAAGVVSDSFQDAKDMLATMAEQDPNFIFTDAGEVFIHIELDDPGINQILWFCGPVSEAGYTPEMQSKHLDSLESLMELCMSRWDESPIEFNDGLMDSNSRTYVATETKPELLDLLSEFYENTPVVYSECMSISVVEVDSVSFETN